MARAEWSGTGNDGVDNRQKWSQLKAALEQSRLRQHNLKSFCWIPAELTLPLTSSHLPKSALHLASGKARTVGMTLGLVDLPDEILNGIFALLESEHRQGICIRQKQQSRLRSQHRGADLVKLSDGSLYPTYAEDVRI